MANGVYHQPCLHAVSCQEDGIAVNQSLSYCRLSHVSYYGFITYIWVGITRDTFGDLYLVCGFPAQQACKEL